MNISNRLALLIALPLSVLSTPLAAFSLNSEPIQPIPQKVEVNLDKVKLGEKLFHEPRLSKDNTISCASCP